MELTVGVAVLASVRSKGARILDDSSVLFCQLSLMPLFRDSVKPRRPSPSPPLGHPHRFERVVSERVGVRSPLVIMLVCKNDVLVVG